MNPPGQRAFAAYRKTEANTLSQRDLIVKLYQGAERFLLQGKLGMQNGNPELACVGCQKARKIFIELASTLNFEQGGEIAERLRDLYLFLIGEITKASLDRDPARLEAIMPVIATLREGWEQIPDEHANLTSLPGGHDGCGFQITT